MNLQERTAREHRLREYANTHFGLVRREDLLVLGLTADAIAGRLATCRLTLVHRGVYAFGHTALLPEGRWLAALWACGGSTVLSHHSAALYHGWHVHPPDDVVHLTTTARLHSRDGIVVHNVRRLEKADVFRRAPFAVTHAPRTLVDLADVLPWAQYRALADGLHSLNVPQIRAAQARAPFRAGAPLVTRLVEADDAHTRSEFERRFLRFAKAHGLPLPEALNTQVAGHQADCLYRERKLVVELDGRAFHRRRAQMRADRARDVDYQLAGFRFMRLVWDDLHPEEATATAVKVRRMLGVG